MNEPARDQQHPTREPRTGLSTDPENEPPRARLVISDDPLQRPRIIIGRRRA
jgi:hypothetical protein